jgi:DNA polymerase III epsilon subunit-like protein
MSFNEIMLDLEFMSLAKNAAIISIGAVRFDLEKLEVREEGFHCVVNLASSAAAGGSISPQTVIWWMQQSEEARKILTEDAGLHIEVALKAFSNFVREERTKGVWGNGSDTDNVILEGAYQRLGWTPPWTYRENRCYRTIAAQLPEINREDFRGDGIHHNALSDAMTQAKHLCAVWKELKGG